MLKEKIRAFAYPRTSSAANTGIDKDSERRKRDSIQRYAAAAGYQIVESFYDEAVSGTDPIETRDGMSALLDAVLSNGTRTILVESPDRFARDPVIQELGHRMLKERGISLVPTTAPDFFASDTPTSELVRNILGAIYAFEKRVLVDKLKGARDRKSAELGRRCEGRKPVADATIKEAKRLYRRSPKTGKRRSLRAIADELAELGHTTSEGKAYNHNSVRQMLVSAGVYAR